MNLFDRAKNILLTPKTEWQVIAGESATLSSLLTSYVLPLALIPALAALVAGVVLPSNLGMRFAITTACTAYITSVLSFILTSYIVDLLAGAFKSEKNLNKSAQLVAYSSTASWVAGILTIIPIIGWLASFAGGIYAIYLMYLGVGPMKNTPEDQKVVYMIIVFIVLIGIAMAIGAVLGMLLAASSMM